MSQENKLILKNRLKSLGWRAGMLGLALGIEFVGENVGLFNLPPLLVALIGLGLGEVSKYLNIDRSKLLK